MGKLQIKYGNPSDLKENPWNPNVMDSLNEEKLKGSLTQLGMVDVIKCRELDDGSLQILSGQHRNRIAIQNGDEVPILNLGKMTDAKAKKISLISNEQYGENDLDLMSKMFKEAGFSEEEIVSISTLDSSEFSDIFAHESAVLNFDDLDFDQDLELDDDTVELQADATATKTHQIMRFKVSIEDAPKIIDFISDIRREQDFTGSDELTNSGDALVYALGTHQDFDHE